MDDGLLRLTNALPGRIDIVGMSTRKSSDSNATSKPGNFFDSHKVARRSCRETGLDDIHFETHKLLSNLQLLFGGHSCAGRLLAITQSCIKNLYYRRISHDVVPPLVIL